MAKRSDFAQKLLDDLRVRKERMATAATASHSHNSNQYHHLPIDAYAYTKQTYRGSTKTRPNEIVSSRNGEMVNRSSRRQRSEKSGGDLSNQIIPYGKAFDNNEGKLKRADLSITNSILGFLHRIQRGRMDRGSNLDRQLASTSHTLSLVQINNISKGAQKLNHILRACCTNGVNMDTYSLTFAKELLQGAIDLEESLGMLVDLQKSSEFMITSQAQNKNRITLLEEEEEEEDEDDKRRMRMEKMQLTHPTFSFDNKMQRAITITNSKEARKIKDSRKQTSTNTGEAAVISNQMADKGRIPNVIAKLMGLDNLPEKKDSGNSNIASSKHLAKGSSSTTLESKQKNDLIKNQKVAVGSFKNVMFGGPDNNLVLQNQKAAYYSESEVVGIKASKGFDKASTINGSARQNYVEVMMGRKQDHPHNSGTVKDRSINGNDPVQILNNMHERRSRVKPAIHIAKEGHTITDNRMQMSNEKKSHLVVQKSILSKDGGSEMTPKNSSKQSINNLQKKKKNQSSRNQPTPFNISRGDLDIVASNEKVKEIVKRKKSSPRYQEFERPNGRQTLKDHKFADSKKIKPEKIEQMLSRRNGQEASGTSSGKLNVLNGAERKRFGIFIEHELLPTTTLYNSGRSGDLQESANDLQYQAVQPIVINLQDQDVPEAPHEGFKTSEVAYHKSKTNGVQEDRMGIQQPPTESENRLKWILVTSQLFVNTAEALFRLNIPFGILQGGHEDSQDQSSKLILDCGYEVMKRKGIRQELKVHTCSKISSITSTVNLIRSLDDLVRKLNEDMEKLKFYGRKKSSKVDVEDYLPKMLEHDVYDKCPDINCMWDLGWNDETSAFIEKYDVIRDTEKHILSVLLDEITKEYCTFKEHRLNMTTREDWGASSFM